MTKSKRCCAGDGGRPSGAALQGEASNSRELLRSKAVVVSVTEKAHTKMCHVGIEKANESEPLMTCRKPQVTSKPGMGSLSRDEPGRQPAYWPGGVRHIGGASSIQALAWNMGTCCPDAKGEIQAAESARVRVPMRDAGADRLVVVMKPGNAGGAKGSDYPAVHAGQPSGRSQ